MSAKINMKNYKNDYINKNFIIKNKGYLPLVLFLNSDESPYFFCKEVKDIGLTISYINYLEMNETLNNKKLLLDYLHNDNIKIIIDLDECQKLINEGFFINISYAKITCPIFKDIDNLLEEFMQRMF